MKIYLAGPMSDLKDHNFPEFDRYAKALREVGHEVISPADMAREDDHVPGSKPWEWYIKRDIPALIECEAIVLMPGWLGSRGARLEMELASAIKLKVFKIHHDEKLERLYQYGSKEL
jgi:Domain of unknown function (DUF4406)